MKRQKQDLTLRFETDQAIWGSYGAVYPVYAAKAQLFARLSIYLH